MNVYRWIRYAAVLWSTALAAPGAAQSSASAGDPSNERLIEALRAFIPHVMRQDLTPGLNIAVARGGRIIWEEGFGFADVAKKVPMTPTTVMHSGSMGKTYTGTAVMQLVEKGYLGLHEPINKYLPFKVINPLGEREITVYDLLTHRSGLAGNDAGSDFVAPKPLGQHLAEEYGKQNFSSYGGTPRWTAKVGTTTQYSNFGLATLGYLVEVANPEKLSFSAYVQKHIMDPLGMTSLEYPAVQDAAHVRPDIFSRMSVGYTQMGRIRFPTPTIYFADYPAGTVVTTPGDHIRLLLAYLNNGEYNGYRLLKPETIRLMLTPQTPRGDRQIGLIWMLKNHGKPDYYFEHGGSHMFGWQNLFRAYPQQELAISIATNRWDLVLWSEPGWSEPAELISDFIHSWLARESAGARPISPQSWGWKTSYVAGLITVSQLKGLLGTASPITPAMIDQMVAGATELPGAPGDPAVWVPEAFRAGIADMLAVQPMSGANLQSFLRSDRLRVLPEELTVLLREMRGRSGFPYVPL